MRLVLPGQEVSCNEPNARFHRHHHLGAYAALLVHGSCFETGDRGRFRVEPGHVLIHRPFDGHSDWIGKSGALFINIQLKKAHAASFGRVVDLDIVIRALERGRLEGEAVFWEQFEPADSHGNDWPDILRRDLERGMIPSLRDWSQAHHLHPAAVSRGFRKAFGISPRRFRLEQRVANAARQIRGRSGSLSDIAAECGFADQAHMTRTVVQMFATTPLALRLLS